MKAFLGYYPIGQNDVRKTQISSNSFQRKNEIKLYNLMHFFLKYEVMAVILFCEYITLIILLLHKYNSREKHIGIAYMMYYYRTGLIFVFA